MNEPKISHSAWKKFLNCPQMYKFHYIDRLRPEGSSVPLEFGIAMDEALNALLLDNGDPYEVFKKKFDWDTLFGKVLFDKRDIDVRVFTAEQLKKIEGRGLNYAAYATLRVKGRLMIEEYEETFLPRIKKVICVQKNIEGRPGVLDAVMDIEGIGVVLIDHKTSARPYPNDKVANDTQLALYCHHEKIAKAGFVVMIKKNCKKMLQILIDDVPRANCELVVESMTQVEKQISEGNYYKNLDACGKYFGKRCPYEKMCWQKNDTGLHYKPNEKIGKKCDKKEGK